MRREMVFLAVAALTAASGAELNAQSCGKADFEAVVDQASGALNGLNQKNKPIFQDKLRQLKEKRGWSHDQFMQEAAPLVQDDKIADWDQQSADFLDKINSSGRESGGQRAPDCALLAEVRSNMAALVESQTAKWAYMFAKIEAELMK